MPDSSPHPTPYPDVNAVLQELVSEVQVILGDRLVGLYLYGSLALGDFDPQKSDLDFAAVTAGEMTEETFRALQSMHRRLAGRIAGGITARSPKWAEELEGSYIPQRSLRRYDPQDTRFPHIDRGGRDLVLEQHDSDWVIQRYVLREHGVVLVGPDPKTLIDPLGPGDLCRAIMDFLWWWELQLQDTSRVRQSGYQAYTVLTMCRILFTLQTGGIVSKPAAARWALGSLGERWAALIERAMGWQPEMEMDRLDETLAFIRFTLDRARELKSVPGNSIDADHRQDQSN